MRELDVDDIFEETSNCDDEEYDDEALVSLNYQLCVENRCVTVELWSELSINKYITVEYVIL